MVNWPYPDLEDKMVARATDSPYKFLDTGLIMGRVEDVKAVLDIVNESAEKYRKLRPSALQSTPPSSSTANQMGAPSEPASSRVPKTGDRAARLAQRASERANSATRPMLAAFPEPGRPSGLLPINHIGSHAPLGVELRPMVLLLPFDQNIASRSQSQA